jgi:predicted peroxiredoxin
MPTMLATANFKNLIQYIILVATTAQNIAETAKVPFLGSTAALCLSITKSVEVSQFFWPLAPYLAEKKTDDQIKQGRIC